MLHIVLMILKIIGIILLVVLGFLLGMILLVLLVPVHYRLHGSYYGELKGRVKVTWLLHIVSVCAAYQDSKADISIRLFGVRLFKQKGKVDLPEAAKDAGADIKKGVSDVEMVESEELLSVQEVKPDTGRESRQDFPHTREKIRDPKEEERKKVIHHEPDGGNQNEKRAEESNKIIRFLEEIKARFLAILKRIETLNQNWEKIRDFIENEENKKTFALIFRQVRRLVRHVLPRRIRGQVTFGFEDPYYTGQVLSIASILYPYYYKSLKLYPVFDQVKLEGEIDFKGRIRMATVLILSARVYLDKNFRTLLKRFR